MGNNLIYMRRRLGIMAQPHRETQTGDLVTFTGIKAPLSILAQIVPVQSGSGDPSPENERPITGWTGCDIPRTGKNLLGGELLRQSLKKALPNGTDDETNRKFTFSSASTATGAITAQYGLSGKFKENTSYTLILSGYNSYTGTRTTNLRLNYTDGSNTNINFPENLAEKQIAVITSNSNKTLASISKRQASGTTILFYDECGLYEGVLNAQDFLAYTGQTVSVDWTDTAGTVYGGSLKVNTDGTGVLTETHVGVDMGSLTWNYASSYAYFTTSIDEIKKYTAGETPSIMCETYKTTTSKSASDWTSAENCTIGTRSGLATIVVKDTAYTDKTVFTTAVTGKKVVYPLASPVIHNLSASEVGQLLALNGVNNIWSNTGEISVEYWKH